MYSHLFIVVHLVVVHLLFTWSCNSEATASELLEDLEEISLILVSIEHEQLTAYNVGIKILRQWKLEKLFSVNYILIKNLISNDSIKLNDARWKKSQ